MILWILQPFFVFSPSTFRQTPVQAHVAGFWMKINPALVEGKWGEGDKVCVFLYCYKLTLLTSFHQD